HRDRPAQVLHRTLGGEERGGHHHRVVGTAPEPDDLAVLQPGLDDREPGAGELDDVRHREPLVLRNYSAVVYHILQSFTGNDTPSIWRSGPLSATFTTVTAAPRSTALSTVASVTCPALLSVRSRKGFRDEPRPRRPPPAATPVRPRGAVRGRHRCGPLAALPRQAG